MVVDTESYAIDAINLIGTYLEEKGITSRNPAENTGAEYENDVFLISAYDWREDLPEEMQVPNFWWKRKNYQVEWYKHLGRGTYANRPIDIDETLEMLQDCISSLDGAAVMQYQGDEDWEDWVETPSPEPDEE